MRRLEIAPTVAAIPLMANLCGRMRAWAVCMHVTRSVTAMSAHAVSDKRNKHCSRFTHVKTPTQSAASRPAFWQLPEWRLVVTRARTQLDHLQEQLVRDLLRVPLDWPAIVSLSSRHHIGPAATQTFVVRRAWGWFP